MRNWHRALVIATFVAILLAPICVSAQTYVTDYYTGYIWTFVDTVGTPNYETDPIYGIENMSMAAEGDIIVSAYEQVLLVDPDVWTVSVLDDTSNYFQAVDAYPDALSDDIYVIRHWNLKGDRSEPLDYEAELQYLPGGVGPGATLYEFTSYEWLRDLQVYPFGERAGNILVLADDGESGYYLAEFERVGQDSVVRLPDVFSGQTGVSLRSFGIAPSGTIYVLDSDEGLFEVVEGDLVPFGNMVGGYFDKMSIGSDGTFYVSDGYWSVVHRLDAAGTEFYPSLSDYDLWSPYAVVAPGFTPSNPGENVVVEPIEGVKLLFEEVVEGGYTTATVTESPSRTSPLGSYVPLYADAPAGARTDFSYVDLTTESVYSRLILVEIYFPGSRMFFAHTSGDTFRDVTIEGSIEDARGVISRFSEAVLVEDTRPLTTVVAYKFQRLLDYLASPPPVGNNYCPEGGLLTLLGYAVRAENLCDQGEIADALNMLARMNEMVRSMAGWCIPDTVPDNQAGDILALSKTLMFSLDQLPAGPADTGRGVPDGVTTLALSVTSPARGSSVIELAGPAGTAATARVYSAAGRLVATLFDGELVGATQRIVWDGTDSTGSRAASGVYFVRLESADDAKASKVVLIR